MKFGKELGLVYHAFKMQLMTQLHFYYCLIQFDGHTSNTPHWNVDRVVNNYCAYGAFELNRSRNHADVAFLQPNKTSKIQQIATESSPQSRTGYCRAQM